MKTCPLNVENICISNFSARYWPPTIFEHLLISWNIIIKLRLTRKLQDFASYKNNTENTLHGRNFQYRGSNSQNTLKLHNEKLFDTNTKFPPKFL